MKLKHLEHPLVRRLARLRGFEVYRYDEGRGTLWAKLKITGGDYEFRSDLRRKAMLDQGWVRVYD